MVICTILICLLSLSKCAYGQLGDTSTSAAKAQVDPAASFQEWMVTCGKTYVTPRAQQRAFTIWHKHVKAVAADNADPNLTFIASLDCSSDEPGPLQPQASTDSSRNSTGVPDAATPHGKTFAATGGAIAQDGCVDTFPACRDPDWVGQCDVPGVADFCPCMCNQPPAPSPAPTASPSPAPTSSPSLGPNSSPSPAPNSSPSPAPKSSPSPAPKSSPSPAPKSPTSPAPKASPSPAPKPSPSPTPVQPGTWVALNGVTYHLYENANFPAIPGEPAYSSAGDHPGYASFAHLYCTGYMNGNPSIPWRSIGWTATTVSGLKCGDRVCVRNRRNGLQTTVYVVDKGGKGFDLDYTRVFKVLDPDSVNYARGHMDIEYAKC